MADYNISAEITADTKGFESGVKKAQTSSKKLSQSIASVVKGFGKSGLSGAITSAGLALGGIGLAVGTAVKAIKGITKALGECAEAYKVQLNAERALDTAISNSPFVSGSASKALKEYASQLQKVSNLGDEEIIPQMTQLIATGRTEAEVMKIIATASDMSASGAMSFDTAITQLNATLNGNIGRLGQQNAELKGLTEEELKSGKAVEILGEKYKGLASATIDTKKQLKNAIGDLKETFGSVFENAMAPMRKFFTDLIQGWADARKAKQEYENSMVAIEKGEATANDYRVKEKKLLEEIEAIEGDLKKQADELGMSYEEAYNSVADWQRSQLEAMKEELETTQMLARMHEGLEKIKKLEGQWAEEEAKKKQEEIEKETKIADLKTEYLKKIAEQEARWEHIKEVTGEQVSNEEKIKFYQDSLVDLMTKAEGKITTNNQLYKDQMEIINKLTEGLENQKKALADIASWEEKLRQQEIKRLTADNSQDATDYSKIKKNLKEILDLNLQQLEAKRESDLKSVEDTENVEEAKAKIVEYYNNEKLELQKNYNEELADITNREAEEEWRAQKEKYTQLAKMAISYANRISNIFSNIGKSVKKVFTGIVNNVKNITKKIFGGAKGLFSKLFEFNPDEALEGLLKLEDKILTFFIETLPKLPKFVASALQSISVLMANIKLNVNSNQIREMVRSITSSISQYIPDILSIGFEIASEIAEGIAQGIKDNAGVIGEMLNNMASIIAQYLPPVVLAIIDAVSAFISAIPDSAIKTMIDGVIDLVIKLASALIDNAVNIAQKLIPALFEIILQLFKKLPEILKTVLWEVVKGLGKIASFLWDGIKKLFGFEHGTNNAPKGLAIVGEAGPELVDFKGGERVYNNRNTQKMLAGAGAGAGNTFNVTFNNLQDTSAYAMMSQLKQYNRQMAINGII